MTGTIIRKIEKNKFVVEDDFSFDLLKLKCFREGQTNRKISQTCINKLEDVRVGDRAVRVH